ncbi:hypothetical protein RRG08_055356 [Elysia crispata]|uniref:Uncharacterized protein n=1 Tax=Elysia crispata TaxID=231223 RepID=A0AAE1E2K1_9GAST|nr:hypothetical protein RRG08_055356 [Elysia crispata]
MPPWSCNETEDPDRSINPTHTHLVSAVLVDGPASGRYCSSPRQGEEPKKGMLVRKLITQSSYGVEGLLAMRRNKFA